MFDREPVACIARTYTHICVLAAASGNVCRLLRAVACLSLYAGDKCVHVHTRVQVMREARMDAYHSSASSASSFYPHSPGSSAAAAAAPLHAGLGRLPTPAPTATGGSSARSSAAAGPVALPSARGGGGGGGGGGGVTQVGGERDPMAAVHAVVTDTQTHNTRG